MTATAPVHAGMSCRRTSTPKRKAAANLERQGFAIYLPRYQKRRSHARKVDTVARPLFPRYLFVAIDLATQRWRAIQSTLGVSHLVCWSDRPASVEDSVIDALKAREDEDGFIKLARRTCFRARGQGADRRGRVHR